MTHDLPKGHIYLNEGRICFYRSYVLAEGRVVEYYSGVPRLSFHLYNFPQKSEVLLNTVASFFDSHFLFEKDWD